MQRSIEGRDYRLFDFRTAEAVACADDLAQIERLAVLLPEAEVNLPDGFPFSIVRQIDEKDLIESPFAQEFGRQ